MLEVFILGLFGSLHCVGMCGPIAFSLPRGKGRMQFFAGRLLYNTGRVVTYSILGGLVALIGTGAKFFQLQQALSIALGVILVLWALSELGLFSKLNWLEPLAKIKQPIGKFQSALRSVFASVLGAGGPTSMFKVGLINGLLPCGFVYMGLFYAVLSADPLRGMLSMALFGAGTFPMMLFLSLSAGWITQRWRSSINRLIPVTIMAVGILFLVRGLALGIPWISPQLEFDQFGKVVMTCCRPPK